ncbi:hypothetical protein ACFQL1_14410 [Halomicroarcula sp. GCM10025709]|uniref:DUF7310 family coiled-coil domain-containing protein n=1 Tax=Haloarcula TaxID=2237 RepID=UPI0024C38478|nr:hypothetical protein [Halomicroarcula sp. YJ-61-S]
MADSETLSERVSAVERAMTDGEQTLPEAGAVAEVEPRVADIETRLADLDERVTELEAATQALRGYVGSIKSVNEDVEQRADAALAAVDRIEDRLDSRQSRADDGTADREATRERPRHEDGRQSARPAQSTGLEPEPFGTRPDGRSDAGREVADRENADGTTDRQTADGIRPPRTVGDDAQQSGDARETGDGERRAGVLARIRSLL